MQENGDGENLEQPAAYSTDGKPLYARPLDIEKDSPRQEIAKLKHQRSAKSYPEISLSEGEYVITVIRRHKIGLVLPFIIGFLVFMFLVVVLADLKYILTWMNINSSSVNLSAFDVITFTGMILDFIFVYIFYHAYMSNKFFLTNESIIQEREIGLVARDERTVSLTNVEDVSYVRRGLLQQMFDYGTIRLSTQGDKANYELTMVANPKENADIINEAVETVIDTHTTPNDN